MLRARRSSGALRALHSGLGISRAKNKPKLHRVYFCHALCARTCLDFFYPCGAMVKHSHYARRSRSLSATLNLAGRYGVASALICRARLYRMGSPRTPSRPCGRANARQISVRAAMDHSVAQVRAFRALRLGIFFYFKLPSPFSPARKQKA